MKFMLQQQQNIKDTYIICASLCITTLITTINPNSDFGFLFLPYYYFVLCFFGMNYLMALFSWLLLFKAHERKMRF